MCYCTDKDLQIKDIVNFHSISSTFNFLDCQPETLSGLKNEESKEINPLIIGKQNISLLVVGKSLRSCAAFSLALFCERAGKVKLELPITNPPIHQIMVGNMSWY